MNAQQFDVALVAFFVLMAIVGWRRGLIVSLLSFVGMVIGAVVARELVNKLADSGGIAGMTVGLYGVIAIILIGFGSSVGAFVGRRVRALLPWKPMHTLDSAGGLVISLSLWSVIIWIVASLLLALPISQTTALLGDSRVVAELDSRVPDVVRTNIDDVRKAIVSVHIPSDLVESLLIDQVQVPDSALTKATNIRAVLDSVVRVEGDAPECNARLSGSGVVFKSGYVLTNAHVVAGVKTVGVRIKGKGSLLLAKVVYFDPRTDVAVLYSKRLDTKVAVMGEEIHRNDSAVIAGFPGGGGLKLTPARVSGVISSSGADIYGNDKVQRRIYTLRSNIIQGDSGAPLISAEGEVVGLIFASSATDKTTGYALTPQEYETATSISAKESVSTGHCSTD